MSPDGSSKPPPEEKLLKLIRAKEPSLSAPVVFQPGQEAVAIVLGQSQSSAATLRWSAILIGFLGLVLLCEIVLIVTEILRPLPYIEAPLYSSSAAPSNKPGSVNEQAAELAVESSTIAKSVSRPLFAVPIVEEVKEKTTGLPSQQASALAARLALLGVVSGEPPQAIIEDSQTQKTYFVSEGQPVAEGARVEKILENRVILDFSGEKIELAL